MRRHEREKANEQSPERGLQRARYCNAPADSLDKGDGPHHTDPEQRANDPQEKQKSHIGWRKR
jgi:hypothetical protein